MSVEFYISAGVLYFSQDRNSNGLYRLDTQTGLATHVGTTAVTGSTVGLAYDPIADILYGSEPFDLLHISRDGSGVVNVNGGIGLEGLTYDPNRDVLYASINGAFFTLDRSNGTKIADLAAPGFDAEGLAVIPDSGLVYAVGNSTLLRSYNPDTNTWTTVGDTGFNWDQGGLAYNPAQHVLYACGIFQGNLLYQIDLATAAATLIGDSGVSLEGGLAFAPGVEPFRGPASQGAEFAAPEDSVSTDD
jgi:DNA-binding beta-propeller fold protein YncE